MSYAHIRTRLFRFLAVVASATFVVLMLEAGSQPADLSKGTTPFASKTRPVGTHPRARLPHGLLADNCNDCVQAEYKECCDENSCDIEANAIYCNAQTAYACDDVCNNQVATRSSATHVKLACSRQHPMCVKSNDHVWQ
jgi:hypothetical protein